MTRQRLGELLIERSIIDEEQLASALEYHRSHRCRLGAAVVDLGYASEEQVLSALAFRLGYERIHLDLLPRSASSSAALRLVPERMARERGVVPLASDQRTLTVALRDPTDLQLVDELSFVTGRRIHIMVAGEREIWRATTRLYHGDGDLELDIDLDLDDEREPPIVALMDAALVDATCIA